MIEKPAGHLSDSVSWGSSATARESNGGKWVSKRDAEERTGEEMLES